jgi:Xaa-Pro aminopeptidase
VQSYEQSVNLTQKGRIMQKARLAALRAELGRLGVAALIVPRADEHLGEYVPPASERLAWLTGFTGSAGLAVVLPDRAALFVDGRYVLQAAAETDPALWERHHITEEPPPGWLAANTAAGARIGYDPMLIGEEGLQRYLDAGLAMIPLAANPIDALWADRPAPPLAPATPHDLAFAGRTSAEKRTDLAATLTNAKQDAAILTDPASIAWLFNIRGEDVPFTPFALGFAILHADARAELFMAPEKLPEPTRAWLGNAVNIADRGALPAALAGLAGRRVRVDPATAPAWFAQTLRAAGATVAADPDPCLVPKACRNATEQQGIRNAHLRDGTAVCRFLHWLAGAAGRTTEMEAASHLHALRAESDTFRGESFATIAGAGEHGAIMHYRVSAATNRPIKRNETFLVDSGAQYPDGTTDITRTIWTGPSTPPAHLKDHATRALKGLIAIATLVFPQGTHGLHLDAVARLALWRAGLDYDHGTGHGVGSYLAVHEGPCSISRLAKPVPLAAGMVLSDEPGYYAPGEYGIRLENLLLAQPADFPKPFLRFETLTLAPFDRLLIEPTLLTPEEITWVNAYHQRVLATLGPLVPPATRGWLAAACRAL